MSMTDEQKEAFETDLAAVLGDHDISTLVECDALQITEFIAECLYTVGQTQSSARLEITGPKGTVYVRINPALPPVSPPPVPPIVESWEPDGDVINVKLGEARAPEFNPLTTLQRKVEEAAESHRTPEFSDTDTEPDPRDVPPGY